MGGGGLRILGHKSWHVWNQKNRDVVQKDEDEAIKHYSEILERSAKADQDFRLKLLRKKSLEDPKEEPGSIKDIFKSNTEIATNDEYEQEKLDALKKRERQFAMYLDNHDPKAIPWYSTEYEKNIPELSAKDQRIKKILDPLGKIISSNNCKITKKKKKKTQLTIEELRKERLIREENERKRANEVSTTLDEKSMPYNSVFNPNFKKR